LHLSDYLSEVVDEIGSRYILQQQASSIGELYNQASLVKPLFDRVIDHLVAKCGGKAEHAELKKILRCSEKIILELEASALARMSTGANEDPDRNHLQIRDDSTLSGPNTPSEPVDTSSSRGLRHVFDLTRGMILCESVKDMKTVLDCLLNLDPAFDDFMQGHSISNRMTTPGRNTRTSTVSSKLSSEPSSPRSASGGGGDRLISSFSVNTTDRSSLGTEGESALPSQKEPYAVRILRVKGRMGPPKDKSLLGDCLINLQILPEQGHSPPFICELQIVHKHSFTTRFQLDGHELYTWVRSTRKLLEVAKQRVINAKAEQALGPELTPARQPRPTGIDAENNDDEQVSPPPILRSTSHGGRLSTKEPVRIRRSSSTQK
jgi:hypothetical protein